MNFFERQDQARRASRRLVFLFVLAVIAVVAAVDAVVFFVLSQAQAHSSGFVQPLPQWMSDNTATVIGTSLVVIGIIALASLYKTVSLNGGGGVVARSLGGVRVSADTTDPAERRLLNVVEEMAIASGVPMPEVYLLEEEKGINAFAAGHSPADAAIGVTRGAIDTLNRSELQGVIAHEFSHILNGDMRLNIRLMGLLFGLLVIALIARIVLRAAPHRRSRKDSGGAIALVALAVFVIGYVGLFFGRLIQAAVSRRRESLADASAVQFTRDPAGLRNALVKIGALSAGSSIRNPEVDEVAHMLFAPGVKRLFATHPPLLQRLRDIDPHFDPAEFERVGRQLRERGTAGDAESLRAGAAARGLHEGAAALGTIAHLVGNPGTQHVRHARSIRESLPEPIVLAARHPVTARALLMCLALDPDPALRERQRAAIAREFDAASIEQMASLQPVVDVLGPEQRMPALMSAFPALRQLAREDRLALLSSLNSLPRDDSHVSLQSYVLRKLAQVHLHDALDASAPSARLTLRAVQLEAHVLLAILARQGHDTETDARRAYEAGMHFLYPHERPAFRDVQPWAEALDRALARLDRLVPAAKEQLIEAIERTIAHDRKLTLAEAELVRAVCATLHCPLPPLIG